MATEISLLVNRQSSGGREPRSNFGCPRVERNPQQELSAGIKRLCSEWVSQVSQMQQLDAAFATRLAACREPAQAAELCGAWMGHRLDSAVSVQHRILEVWLESIVAPAMKTEPKA